MSTRHLDVNHLIMRTIALAIQVTADGMIGQLACGVYHGPETVRLHLQRPEIRLQSVPKSPLKARITLARVVQIQELDVDAHGPT